MMYDFRSFWFTHGGWKCLFVWDFNVITAPVKLSNLLASEAVPSSGNMISEFQMIESHSRWAFYAEKSN